MKSKANKKLKQEAQNKSKAPNKNNNSQSTKISRSTIGANWQAFLATQKTEDVKKKIPISKPERTPVEKYLGPFRRTIKQQVKMDSHIEKKDSLTEVIVLDSDKTQQRKQKTERITKFIGIDCEMVGIGDGNDNMLARVSLVNKEGDCIYDKFVKPREPVVDYRTAVSGVRPEDLVNGEDFNKVAKDVAELLKHRVLVGHAVRHDLEVLFLSHPKRHIRDTSRYKPFRSLTKGHTPSLKRLAKEILGVDIQGGEHSSVEDAKAAMQLYVMHSKDWEKSLKSRRNRD